MENANSSSVGQWLNSKLSGQTGQPLTNPALTFTRRMLPMLGITSMPEVTGHASTDNTAMTNTAPDETTLSGRAESRIRHEGTKQQQNLESISFNALPFIREDAKPDDVNEDWLTNFFDKGRLISDEDMHKLWSHVLSSEVNQPGSFSIRTVNLLATLSKKEAALFRKLCSYVWSDESPDADSTYFTLVTNEMVLNSTRYHLEVTDYFNLHDIGLINFHNDASDYFVIGSEGDAPFLTEYHGNRFQIQETREGKLLPNVEDLNAGMVKLTYSGAELAQICAPDPDFEYMNYIVELWRTKSIQVTSI